MFRSDQIESGECGGDVFGMATVYGDSSSNFDVWQFNRSFHIIWLFGGICLMAILCSFSES